MHAFGVCGACVDEELGSTGLGEDDVLTAALELELVVAGSSVELLLVNSRATVEELVRGGWVDVLSDRGRTAGVAVDEELLDCATAPICNHMCEVPGTIQGNRRCKMISWAKHAHEISHTTWASTMPHSMNTISGHRHSQMACVTLR